MQVTMSSFSIAFYGRKLVSVQLYLPKVLHTDVHVYVSDTIPLYIAQFFRPILKIPENVTDLVSCL